MQRLITLQDLRVQLWINLHTVAFHQLPSCLKVTLALDALHLGQKITKKATQRLIIRDCHEGPTIPLREFDHTLLCPLLIGPARD